MTVKICQAIVPNSRTPNSGSLWEATASVDGHDYSARSRRGAPFALARTLVEAGVPDQGVIVETQGIAGSTGWRSLAYMATRTMTEGVTTRLHTTRHTDLADGIFPSRGAPVRERNGVAEGNDSPENYAHVGAAPAAPSEIVILSANTNRLTTLRQPQKSRSLKRTLIPRRAA